MAEGCGDVACDSDSGAGLERPCTTTLRRGEVAPDRCARCRASDPSFAVRAALRYCSTCFADSIAQRVRNPVAKAAGIPNGARALLAVSGGPASMLLLHQMGLFHNVDPTNPRRVRKLSHLAVCTVDLSAIMDDTYSAEHPSKIESVQSLASSFNLPFTEIPIEDVYLPRTATLASPIQQDSDSNHNKPFAIDPETGVLLKGSGFTRKDADSSVLDDSTLRRATLRTALAVAGSRSSQEDLARSLMYKVLVRFANENKFSVILFGDTCQRTCVRILAEVSRGRGFGIPTVAGVQPAWSVSQFMDDNMAEAPEKCSPLALVRPLHELSDKEVAMYNKDIAKLDESQMEISSFWKQDTHPSIDSLTDKFIEELVPEFPMTTSIVTRTVGKLSYDDMLESNNSGSGTMFKSPVGEVNFTIKRKDKKNGTSETVVKVPGMECPLCGLPFTKGGASWRTRHTVETLAEDEVNSGPKEVPDILCYACQSIVSDSGLALERLQRANARKVETKSKVEQDNNNNGKLAIPIPASIGESIILRENAAIKDHTSSSESTCCTSDTMKSSCCNSNGCNSGSDRKGREWMRDQISEFLLLE